MRLWITGRPLDPLASGNTPQDEDETTERGNDGKRKHPHTNGRFCCERLSHDAAGTACRTRGGLPPEPAPPQATTLHGCPAVNEEGS